MRNKFKATKKQEATFNRVVKAMKAADMAGLVFFGKGTHLVAYTEYADEYAAQHDPNCEGTGYGLIPCLKAENVLADSVGETYSGFGRASDNPDYKK